MSKIEQAFFDWWDRPGRPTIVNHRIAFEAGYRAASVGGDGDMLRAALASVGRNAERQDAEERLGPKEGRGL